MPQEIKDLMAEREKLELKELPEPQDTMEPKAQLDQPDRMELRERPDPMDLTEL